MTVLAPKVGVKAAELLVPVKRLKASKQLKTVEQRHLARYFAAEEEVAA